MKKKLTSILKNLTTNEKLLISCNCIINKNKIKYEYDNIKYILNIKDKEIIVVRESDEFIHTMPFQKNKNTISNYNLKENNLSLDLNIETIDIKTTDNNIYIKYKIKESENIFEYIIEMGDI